MADSIAFNRELTGGTFQVNSSPVIPVPGIVTVIENQAGTGVTVFGGVGGNAINRTFLLTDTITISGVSFSGTATTLASRLRNEIFFLVNTSAVGASTPTSTVLFSPVASAGGSVTYSESTGEMTLTPSGANGVGLSGAELNYIVVRNTQWIALGLLANGDTAIVALNTLPGVMNKISNAGVLGSNVQVFPAVTIAATATRIKASYNSSGDITISYKANESDVNYTAWGTVLKAALVAAGFNITSQQMGLTNFSVNNGVVVEFQKKTGDTRTITALSDIPGGTDMFSRVYPWYGKTVCLVGDSMTNEFNNVLGTFNPQTTSAYVGRIKSKLKAAAVYRRGYNGGSFGSSATVIGAAANVTSIKSTYADLFVIMGCVNDWSQNCVLGDASTATTALGAATTTTVGGLYKLINDIRTDRPEAIVVYCSSPPHSTQTTANTVPLLLKDYVDACIKACELFSVPYIDIWRKVGFQYNNTQHMPSAKYIVDTIHPTDLGYERITDLQAKFINSLKA